MKRLSFAERLSAGNGCNNKEENKANQRIYKAILMAKGKNQVI